MALLLTEMGAVRQQTGKPPGSSAVNSRRGVGFEMLAAFSPGTPPMVMGDGFGLFVPAGSKLVFQMHYTPIGTEQKDRSKIGFIFADPKNVTHMVVTENVINKRFVIPPKASNSTV